VVFFEVSIDPVLAWTFKQCLHRAS